MKKQVVLKNIHNFEPRHIFECGQCFRWERQRDGSYTGIALGRVLNVARKDGFFIFNNVTEEEFSDIWQGYFDLHNDYGKIKQTLSTMDIHMKNAVTYGSGIRILNQNLWECILSFIISANNNIPRIQGIIQRLCKRFGDPLEYGGKTYYTFPDADRINANLAFLRVGYRESYLLDACFKVRNGVLDLNKLHLLSTDQARQELMKIKGIGPKVADCILLFGMKRHEVFPVDVWVKRCVTQIYGKEMKNLNPKAFAAKKFGGLAGYAQQYLFYYMRETANKRAGGIQNA